MMGFHFSIFLSKYILEKLLVWYWCIGNIQKVFQYFMKSRELLMQERKLVLYLGTLIWMPKTHKHFNIFIVS